MVRSIPNAMSDEQHRRVSEVVKDTGRKLMRYVRARVSNDADAEDVMQDVWRQLLVTLETGPVERIGAWLYTVARRRIIDRNRRPRPASLDSLAEEGDDEDGFDFAGFVPRDDQTPRTERLRNLFWEQLHRALAELPEEQREVFVWHELEAMSFQDIAELTGENVNTLISRKRYAVLHLRERLEPLRAEFAATLP